MDPLLTPEILAQLYPKGLYLIGGESGPTAPKTATQKRKYLVISSEELSSQLYELLAGIMGACKIDMKDVNVMMFNGNMDYKTLMEQYGSSFILMFGTEPDQLDLPIVFPHFQLQKFNNASWISSPDLGMIQNDKLMKSKLWLCLKQAFSL